MRLLLLIMTGLGFTLGLLCGLLLQLPADGLPADNNNNNNINNHDTIAGLEHEDDAHSFRSRRSFSDESTVLDPAHSGKSAQASSGGSSESGSPPAGAAGNPGIQSPPNPQIGSNPFVSSGGSHNNGGPQPSAGLNGQAGDQAERRGSPDQAAAGSDREGEKTDNTAGGGGGAGGEGYDENESPSSPPPPATPTQPVTSFTLRLKNTGGGKFVVDSAVRRHRDEDTHVVEPASSEDEEENKNRGRGDTRAQTPHIANNNQQSSQTHSNNTNTNTSSLKDIVSGVLWSKALEDSCAVSKGFEAQELSWAWRRKAAGMQVVAMEAGCGRMQNRLLTFKDGSKACARYRLNTDQIQGEVFSYYLARLLNVTNLPPALLLPVDAVSPQWRSVHLDMSLAQWADGRLVVLTRWLHSLQPAFIPPELREDDRQLHPTAPVLGKKTHAELCDLLQWSDLIVFDYLTANLDRLVNNMFNKQWNAEMMSNPAHNLERTKSGSLVFLDNESGLFHGYRLLEKYSGYHESLLSSVCVFRASTARAVGALFRAQSVGKELHRLFVEGEVHHRHLPALPDKNAAVLADRLENVQRQMEKCEALYGAGATLR